MTAPCYFCGMPAVRYGSAHARILDLLSDQGGWWTETDIVDRLDLSKAHVHRAVHRLRPLLESRPNPDAPNRLQYRFKERAV